MTVLFAFMHLFGPSVSLRASHPQEELHRWKVTRNLKVAACGGGSGAPIEISSPKKDALTAFMEAFAHSPILSRVNDYCIPLVAMFYRFQQTRSISD